MRLRIVVVDDNAAFLEKLVSVLETEFEVVAKASDGRLGLEIIRIYQPDVAIVDLEMPAPNGIEVTRELTKRHSNPAIVVCSVQNDPEIVEAARLAGALGYVFKARIASDLIKAVGSVAVGRPFVSQA
jgi:DNA-binding NarL/FixJ family response regulator